MVNENCKICNHTFPLTETFCPECGFERHIYPKSLSPELKRYEEERINKYKEQRIKKEKELKLLEKNLNKVSSELSETSDSLRQKEKELKIAISEIQANKQEIAQLKKQQDKANQEKKELQEMVSVAKTNNNAYGIRMGNDIIKNLIRLGDKCEVSIEKSLKAIPQLTIEIYKHQFNGETISLSSLNGIKPIFTRKIPDNLTTQDNTISIEIRRDIKTVVYFKAKCNGQDFINQPIDIS